VPDDDPDTLERDPEVLYDIGRRFKGRLALNAAVLRPGNPAHRNGWPMPMRFPSLSLNQAASSPIPPLLG